MQRFIGVMTGALACLIVLSAESAQARNANWMWPNAGYCNINGRQVMVKDVQKCAARQARAGKRNRAVRP
jgi:hypothetical protein